jgi:hypothetical protein
MQDAAEPRPHLPFPLTAGACSFLMFALVPHIKIVFSAKMMPTARLRGKETS